jgi:tetratricopeptide (TPR) repeat protein
VAGTLAYLGDTYLLSGNHELAESSLATALLLFQGADDPGGEAETMNLYAALALAAGEPQEAHLRHVRALRIARRISSAKDEADAIDGIARCWQAEGNIASVRCLYSKALALYEALPSPADAARVRATLDELPSEA